MIQRKQTLPLLANERAASSVYRIAYFFRYHVFDIAESGVSRRNTAPLLSRMKTNFKNWYRGKWKCKSPRARGGVVEGKPLQFFFFFRPRYCRGNATHSIALTLSAENDADVSHALNKMNISIRDLLYWYNPRE